MTIDTNPTIDPNLTINTNPTIDPSWTIYPRLTTDQGRPKIKGPTIDPKLNREEFFYSNLLMHVPWRDEKTIIGDFVSYEFSIDNNMIREILKYKL